MSKVEGHEHHFEVRYKRGEGSGMEIRNPCKCSGCDQLVFVEYENYRFRMTIIPHEEQVTYSIYVAEARNERE